MYFVDEWNSGSIYKFTPQASGNLSAGQTFVLKINDYSGDPTKDWNDPLNTGAVRTGLGTWVPITDTSGVALPGISDPYLRGPNTTETSRGGRVAANEVMGTPYGRPEDIDVATLANGNQAIYFAATSEQAIYSVELSGNGPVVRLAASDAVTPKNLGFGGTAATLRSPDNIAVDPNGNIYVIEDQPNITTPGAPGGDVWMLRDTNDDGIAESLDLFASHGVAGAESTGMIWDPTGPNRFFISIQHPESMVTAGGIGDALWVVTVPEPSGICGIAIGIVVAGLCRRRR